MKKLKRINLSVMVKVNSYFLVEIFMKGIGAEGRETATQFLAGKMVIGMKVNSFKIKETVSAGSFGKMGLFIMVIMKMMRKVALDDISTSVAIFMKDNSSKANKMDMEKFGTTKLMISVVIFIRVIGKITNAQVTVNTFLQTERDILDSF